MPHTTHLQPSSMYETIDDVLASPPARLARRAHVVIFSTVVLTAVLLGAARYPQRKTYSVQIQVTPASCFYADAAGFQVRRFFVQKDTFVLAGEPLMLVDRKAGSAPDTVCAMSTGWLSWIRAPRETSFVGPGATVFAVRAQSSPQEFRLLLPQASFPDSLFEPGRTLQMRTVDGRTLNTQFISKVYASKPNAQLAVDARLLPTSRFAQMLKDNETATLTVDLEPKRLIDVLFD